MTRTRFLPPLAGGIALLCMTAISKPALAQIAVFDASNFAENVMTAARELQQVDNEIQSLTNQAQMLVNQGRNLASLPMSTLTQLETSVQQTENLLSQAQNISFNVQQIETAFTGTYGAIPANATDASLIAGAQTRWQNSVGGFEDSLKMQAGVVGNIPGNSSAMSSLVSASQSATGALQAAQAGNQLLALQSQQLSDLVAVVAAKGRADALQQANEATAVAQGQAQYQLFSAQTPYVPYSITMFGN
jgi:P-type conjugative transfer protein TrbJ